MQLDRLLSRIRAALQDYASEFEQRALAAEYTELCAKAARRLEEIVPLIRGGQDYAALQIAEAPPPVLDLVQRLSFAEAEQWRTFCLRRGLPAAQPFDELHVELVNQLYGRKIGETHPLYRDYRHAIRTRQEQKALRILQSIRRVNPDDANAHAEYARLAHKIIERKRTELAALLIQPVGRANDDPGHRAVLTLLDELEADGWTPDPNDPVAEQALALRAEEQLQNARDRALALATPLHELRAAGRWEETLPLLAEWDEIRAQFSFTLPPDIEAGATATRNWAAGILAARNRKEENQRLARETAARLDEFAKLPASQLPDRTLATHLAELRARAAELAAHAAAPELSERLARALADADAILRRRARNRRTLAAAAAAALLLGVAFTAWSQARARARETQLQNLQALLSRRAWSELAAAVDTIDKSYPEISTDPGAAPLLTQARALLAAQQAARARFARELAQLDTLAPPNPTPAQLAALLDTVNSLDAQATQLGPEDAPAARADLAKRRLKWTQALAAVQEQRAASLAAVAARLDQFFAQNLSPPPAAAAAADLARQGRAILADAAAVAADSAHESAAEQDARARLADAAKKLDALDNASRQALADESLLASAHSLDDYRRPLERLQTNPLAGEGAVAAARALAAENAGLAAAPQRILLPDDPALWAFLASLNDAVLQPAADDQQEDIAFARLVTNDLLANTYLANYIQYNDGIPGNATAVYLAGPPEEEDNKWQKNEEVRQEVKILNPDGTTSGRTARVVRFDGQNPRGDLYANPQLSPESRLVARLRQAYDPRSGAVREPLLRVLDDIRADPAVSPLLKAYLQQEILGIMQKRPNDWGLAFSPSAQLDARELTRLTGGDLQPADWVFPANPKLVDQLAAFYARTASHHYYDEASQSLQKLLALRSTPVFYAGYVDLSGKPALAITATSALPDNGANGRFWGLDTTGAWRVLYQLNGNQVAPAAAADGHAPAPLTPLLYLPNPSTTSTPAAPPAPKAAAVLPAAAAQTVRPATGS